jgi:hypothetical protein
LAHLVARVNCGADAFDRDFVARDAVQQRERVSVAGFGIIRGATGYYRDIVTLGQFFRDLRGHFCGGRRVRRIVFVQEQDVHLRSV